MEIRRMKENELLSVIKLATGIYEYSAKPQVQNPAMVQQFYDYMQPQVLIEQFRAESLLLWGAIEGQTLCAVGAMQSNAHITMLYVHPYYQKRGIGAAMLQEMIGFAEHVLRAGRVTVHAIPAASAGFFIKNGFTQMPEISSGVDFCPLEYRFAAYVQPAPSKGISTGMLVFILAVLFVVSGAAVVVSILYSLLLY